MTGFGVLLIILGVGSLLLPMFNLQFTLMELVDPYQPWAGIIVAVLGAALIAFGLQRARAAAPTASAPAAPTTSVSAARAAPVEPAAPAAPAAQAVPPPVETAVPDATGATTTAADAAADANRDQA